MRHIPGKPFHRSTLARRKKAQELQLHKEWRGKGRAPYEQARAEELLAYAGAMLSMVLDLGYCDYFQIKRYPRASDPERDAGDTDPTVYPTLPKVKKRLMESGFNESLLFIAACEACKPNLKTRTVEHKPKSIRAMLRETFPGQDVSVYEREIRKSGANAKWVKALLADASIPDDTKYYWGLKQQRENSGKVAVTEVAEKLGVDLSRRMVCYYKKQPDHRRAVELMIDILGDLLPGAAYTGSFTTVRPDLMRLLNAQSSPSRRQAK